MTTPLVEDAPRPADPVHRTTPARLFPAACAVAVLVFAATYANTLHNSFQFDDTHVVKNNLFIRSLANIPHFFADASTFSSVPANAAYRPLVTTTLAIDYAIGGGLDPTQFHITQLVLLALLGTMLFFFFRKLFEETVASAWNRYAALAAALLFTIHTVNTETANYISARSEILSTMGIIGSFLTYFAFPPLRRRYLFLLPMVIGAFAKEPAIMFAPMLFVYVLLFEEHVSFPELFSTRGRESALRALRACAVPLCVGAVTFVVVQLMRAEGASYGGGSRVQYLQTQLFAWLHYAKLFVLPVGLTADTDLELIAHWYDTRVIAGLLFVVAILYAVWASSKRPLLRPVTFGLVWFVLGLLPSSSVFPLTEMTNEHRVFLPYIGLVSAAVWMLLTQLRKRIDAQPERAYDVGKAALMATGAIVVILALSSYVRNRAWSTEKVFWADVVAKSPRNARALMNFGSILLREGDLAGAKERFERAHVIAPDYGFLEINLAIVNDRLGAPGVAEGHYLRALQLQPNITESHYYYAYWLTGQGRAPEALPHLRSVIAMSPATIDARELLMNLYFATGDDVALDSLVKATIAISPTDSTASAYASGGVPVRAATNDADGFFVRGLALTTAGDHVDAAVAYRQALKLKPDNADINNNLGWARGKLGFYEAAILAFENALKLRPNYPLAQNNLAWARAQLAKRQ